MTDSAPIGCIGVGRMGGPMVRRLLDAGHEVVAFDIDAHALARAEALGATASGSPREVADRARLVIASVPDGAASRVVALGPDGIVHGRSVRTYVETSTIGVTAARAIAGALAQAGIAFVDAPVSGGPRAIVAGTLTTMVAAAPEALAAAVPALDAICGRRFLVGDRAGIAQACKLVNNAIMLSTLQIAAEAAAFGVLAGLDAATMIEVVNASSGASAVTQKKFPASILNRRFDFGASMATAAKDMALYVEDAQAIGALLEGTPRIADAWRRAAEAGDSARDFTRIVQWFEASTGVTVGKAEA